MTINGIFEKIRKIRKRMGIVFIAALALIVFAGIATAITAPAEEWNRTFGGINDDMAESVQQTSDGGYILAGSTTSFGVGYSDAWLIKTDSLGNQQWNKTFGGMNNDSINSVRQTSDGGYILAGETSSFGLGGQYDGWLIKTDSSGNEQWNRTYGWFNYDWIQSVQQTIDGGYILGGHMYSYASASDNAWLVKTDSSGNEQWSRTFGGTNYDEANSVYQTFMEGMFLLEEE